MEHKTTSPNQAAALLSQLEFSVGYVGLEPTANVKRVNFVLSLETDQPTLNEWLIQYKNQRSLVEPTLYDSKYKMLTNEARQQTN